jgi:hypothetical protein
MPIVKALRYCDTLTSQSTTGLLGSAKSVWAKATTRASTLETS